MLSEILTLKGSKTMAHPGSVAVVGVGHTRYGKLPEYDPYELGLWALKEALADSGLRLEDIDGLIVNRIPDYQRFCEIAGLNPSYVSTTPGANDPKRTIRGVRVMSEAQRRITWLLNSR